VSPLVFTNVSIFDGSGAPLFPGEVRVEGERITAVSKGDTLPREGAQLIDGGGGVLMPGMVESHAHLSFPTSIGRVHPAMGGLPPEEHLLRTAHNARVLLESGFTSAYSAGSLGPRFEIALKKEIDGGYLPGPRLVASSIERQPEFKHGPHAGSQRVQRDERGPEAVAAFVRDQAEAGVDSIKFLLSGDEGFNVGGSHQLTYDEEEVAAAGRAAQESGVWLACHAQATQAVKWAVRFGFRSIYHCSHADAEALDMLEEAKDRIFVSPAPGLLWSRAYEAEDFGIDRATAERMGAFSGLEKMQAIYPELRKRGVRVLPGGDYGFPYNPIGRNARDLQLFVDLFGFSPLEALKAATSQGGELMGLDVGRVEAGYLADLLLVDGDPTRDVRVLEDHARLRMIMKGGAMHKAIVPLAA
jgi:imidazolonepropionase-like amidohydrolase